MIITIFKSCFCYFVSSLGFSCNPSWTNFIQGKFSPSLMISRHDQFRCEKREQCYIPTCNLHVQGMNLLLTNPWSNTNLVCFSKVYPFCRFQCCSLLGFRLIEATTAGIRSACPKPLSQSSHFFFFFFFFQQQLHTSSWRKDTNTRLCLLKLWLLIPLFSCINLPSTIWQYKPYIKTLDRGSNLCWNGVAAWSN